MKVLAVGDIVGEAGVRKLKGILPDLKKRDEIDFVVTNGENAIENKKVDEVKQEEVQTKKEEIEIKKKDYQNLKNFEDEKLNEQDKDSIKSDEFEVEDELIDEDKDNHVKAINLVGITMKKYGHQLQKDKNSKILSNIN